MSPLVGAVNLFGTFGPARSTGPFSMTAAGEGMRTLAGRKVIWSNHDGFAVSRSPPNRSRNASAWAGSAKQYQHVELPVVISSQAATDLNVALAVERQHGI
jgi:hypothetical protein